MSKLVDRILDGKKIVVGNRVIDLRQGDKVVGVLQPLMKDGKVIDGLDEVLDVQDLSEDGKTFHGLFDLLNQGYLGFVDLDRGNGDIVPEDFQTYEFMVSEVAGQLRDVGKLFKARINGYAPSNTKTRTYFIAYTCDSKVIMGFDGYSKDIVSGWARAGIRTKTYSILKGNDELGIGGLEVGDEFNSIITGGTFKRKPRTKQFLSKFNYMGSVEESDDVIFHPSITEKGKGRFNMVYRLRVTELNHSKAGNFGFRCKPVAFVKGGSEATNVCYKPA